MKTYRRHNLGLGEDHATFNRECPVYQNSCMLRKRRIGLAIWQPRKNHGIYTNIQGLSYNFAQLEIIATKIEPDFIMLSETHITEKLDECETELLTM